MLPHDSPIYLRKLEETDLESIYAFRNDHEITSQLEGFSVGYARADLRDWLDHHRGLSNEVLYAIATRKDDRCVGHVGLYQIDHRVGKAEFGIVIGDRASQGQGWGMQASSAMIRFGFNELHLHKIHLQVLVRNDRATRLYERLGFTSEGVMRDDQYRGGEYLDVRVMSLLREEWEARDTTASS